MYNISSSFGIMATESPMTPLRGWKLESSRSADWVVYKWHNYTKKNTNEMILIWLSATWLELPQVSLNFKNSWSHLILHNSSGALQILPDCGSTFVWTISTAASKLKIAMDSEAENATGEVKWLLARSNSVQPIKFRWNLQSVYLVAPRSRCTELSSSGFPRRQTWMMNDDGMWITN